LADVSLASVHCTVADLWNHYVMELLCSGE